MVTLGPAHATPSHDSAHGSPPLGLHLDKNVEKFNDVYSWFKAYTAIKKANEKMCYSNIVVGDKCIMNLSSLGHGIEHVAQELGSEICVIHKWWTNIWQMPWYQGSQMFQKDCKMRNAVTWHIQGADQGHMANGKRDVS